MVMKKKKTNYPKTQTTIHNEKNKYLIKENLNIMTLMTRECYYISSFSKEITK